jgi:hypothetical protein
MMAVTVRKNSNQDYYMNEIISTEPKTRSDMYQYIVKFLRVYIAMICQNISPFTINIFAQWLVVWILEPWMFKMMKIDKFVKLYAWLNSKDAKGLMTALNEFRTLKAIVGSFTIVHPQSVYAHIIENNNGWWTFRAALKTFEGVADYPPCEHLPLVASTMMDFEEQSKPFNWRNIKQHVTWDYFEPSEVEELYRWLEKTHPLQMAYYYTFKSKTEIIVFSDEVSVLDLHNTLAFYFLLEQPKKWINSNPHMPWIPFKKHNKVYLIVDIDLWELVLHLDCIYDIKTPGKLQCIVRAKDPRVLIYGIFYRTLNELLIGQSSNIIAGLILTIFNKVTYSWLLAQFRSGFIIPVLAAMVLVRPKHTLNAFAFKTIAHSLLKSETFKRKYHQLSYVFEQDPIEFDQERKIMIDGVEMTTLEALYSVAADSESSATLTQLLISSILLENFANYLDWKAVNTVSRNINTIDNDDDLTESQERMGKILSHIDRSLHHYQNEFQHRELGIVNRLNRNSQVEILWPIYNGYDTRQEHLDSTPHWTPAPAVGHRPYINSTVFICTKHHD